MRRKEGHVGMIRTAFAALRAAILGAALMTGISTAAMAETAHDFEFLSIDGAPLPLSAFEGKAVLVVNTASFCGFTRQYEGLQALWEEYRDRGLVVLGVPSNDFGGQEPGSAEEIKAFCTVNYAIDFPMTEKVTVKGADAHPFYRWAAGQLGAMSKPRWNFYKILISPDGRAVAWFASTTKPQSDKLRRAVEQALPKSL